MTRTEILRMANNVGLGRHLDQIEAIVRQVRRKTKPLTPTERVYLEHLTEPRSLRDLSAHFGCTTEGARKHLKALDAHGLITRELRFKWANGKRGAWAWYYQAKETTSK
jgi:predicted ArsR family transcriptional regulator